jgi:hypothetical protein
MWHVYFRNSKYVTVTCLLIGARIVQNKYSYEGYGWINTKQVNLLENYKFSYKYMPHGIQKDILMPRYLSS